MFTKPEWKLIKDSEIEVKKIVENSKKELIEKLRSYGIYDHKENSN